MTAQTFGFYDSARYYTAAEWSRMFQAIQTPGVAKGIDNELALSAGPGLAVTVSSGMAIARGRWFYQDGDSVVALNTADPSNPRIDRIITRFDFVNKVQTLTKLTGTPAGSPTAPALTQTSLLYEVLLANVAVAAGASSISGGNITDQRAFSAPGLHDIVAGHSFAGLTANHAMIADSATAASFKPMQHGWLTNVGVNDHHAQAHGAADHTDRTRSIFVKAVGHVTVSGSPGTSFFGTSLPVVTLPDAAETRVAFGPVVIPADWTSGDVTPYLYWTRLGAESAGNVVLDLRRTAPVGDGLSLADGGSGDTTIAAPGQEALKISAFPAITAASAAGKLASFGVIRKGADGADTFTGAVAIIGVRLDYTADA
jgi:hypothetical protein